MVSSVTKNNMDKKYILSRRFPKNEYYTFYDSDFKRKRM